MKFFEEICVAVIAAIPFIWTLDGEFAFDDSEAILNNDDVKRDLPDTFYNIWKHDFWGSDVSSNLSHKSYRPLTIFTFRLNKYISGNELIPLHFKITNLLIHVICSVLVYVTIDTLINKNIIKRSSGCNIALLSSILFAVHPVHVEVVSGIVGRADSLAAIFFLLCLLFYNKSLKTLDKIPKTSYFFISLLCCAVSMLFKETGITALAVCGIYDILVINNVDLQSKKYRNKQRNENQYFFKFGLNNIHIHTGLVMRLLVIFVYTSILLVCRWAIMGYKGPLFQEIDNPAAFHPNFLNRVLTFNYIYFINILLLIWPQWLCFDWSMGCISILTWDDPKVFLVLAFWIFLSSLTYTSLFAKSSLKFQRCLIVALAILILPFLPASNIFFSVGFVLAERILYIPSIGFCIIIALGFNNIYKMNKNSKAILVCFMILIVCFGMRSMYRSREWQNQHLLFESGLEVCPLNAKVHYNIGKNSGDISNYEKAEKEYRTAIQLYPKYYQAMNNLANLLKSQMKYTEAESLLVEALEIKHDFPAAWMNLGIVYSNIDKFEKAERAYMTALSQKRNYPNCYYNLGNLYLKMEILTLAEESWLKAIQLEPSHNMAWSNLLALLDKSGQLDKALSMASSVLTALPNSPTVHFNLANIYGKKSDNLKAEYHFKEAIRLRKDDPLAIHFANLGVLYHRWGKKDEAMTMYEKALEIDPNLSSAHINIKKLQS